MRDRIVKKGLVLGIILLFVGVGIVPINASTLKDGVTIDNVSSITFSCGKGVIYIDDDFNETTPGWNITHFDEIQKGIDNASDDDTIFVCNGTYYENLLVDKSINLIGENKDNTIIDGNGTAFVVELMADFIIINGFTIQNGGKQNCFYDGGIIASSSHNNIFGNIINNSYCGIYAWHSKNNIYENIIENNTNFGIVLSSASNTIYKNIITNNSDNIYLLDSSENKIFDNTITKTKWHGYGILMYGSSEKNNIYSNTITDVHIGIGSKPGVPTFGYNNISNNHITETVYWAIEIRTSDNKIIGNYMKNSYGITLIKGPSNIVMMNTFDGCDLSIDNCYSIKIFCNNFFNSEVTFNDCLFNIYLKNYWNKPCLIKIIVGKMGVIPWFNIDFFPAQKPY